MYATGIPWAEYERLLVVRDENRRGVRITMDRGHLELDMGALAYESRAWRLKWIVHELVKGLNVPVLNAGPRMLFLPEVSDGLETDNCYYLSSAAAALDHVGGRAAMPPPDLVIRVLWPGDPVPTDERYAALRVRELWRLEDGTVTMWGLGPDRAYHPVGASLAFPPVTAAELTRVLREVMAMGDLEGLRQVSAWIKTFAPSDPPVTVW